MKIPKALKLRYIGTSALKKTPCITPAIKRTSLDYKKASKLTLHIPRFYNPAMKIDIAPKLRLRTSELKNTPCITLAVKNYKKITSLT
jgi:hypothetical protein